MSAPEVLFDRAGEAAGAAGPLVTVAVSVFDYAEAVASALDSAAAQTHRNLELVVVDDASRDRSAEAVAAWMARHAPRFARTRLLRHPRNLGLSAARNTAFAAAEGAAVMVLDADNALLPPAVARLHEALEDAGAACAYSQLLHHGAGVGVGVGDVWRRENFLRDNYVDAMALVRREAWAQVGGYAPVDYGWEDYDFWCKFVEAGLTGVYVPELLCRYHVRDRSMVRTETTEERRRLVHGMLARHPWLRLKVEV
ncbi:MAG: glycosyltransferase family 2 protein [Caulobacteraceae bacterium]|nr:glycosyltransferase family 2 protein [Caulobacter sp.]